MLFKENINLLYREIGAFESDIIYIYSDLRGFSPFINQFVNKNKFLEVFIEPFLNKGITVIIPTFSYTTSGIFNTGITKTNLGALNNWILNHPKSERSEHPLFSYSAIGSKSREILINIGKSAFGYDCVFNRLLKFNTKFLHIGRPVSDGNTIIHFIEQNCGATYRYNKNFNVNVYRDKTYIGNNFSAFLRIRNDKNNFYGFDFKRSSKILLDKELISSANLSINLTDIQLYDAKNAFEILSNEFYKDNLLFLKPGTKLPYLDL